MSEVCFSGPALSLLTALALVLQGAIVSLFWQFKRAQDDALQDARAERDRAISRLDQALQLGTTVAQTALPEIRR